MRIVIAALRPGSPPVRPVVLLFLRASGNQVVGRAAAMEPDPWRQASRRHGRGRTKRGSWQRRSAEGRPCAFATVYPSRTTHGPCLMAQPPEGVWPSLRRRRWLRRCGYCRSCRPPPTRRSHQVHHRHRPTAGALHWLAPCPSKYKKSRSGVVITSWNAHAAAVGAPPPRVPQGVAPPPLLAAAAAGAPTAAEQAPACVSFPPTPQPGGGATAATFLYYHSAHDPPRGEQLSRSHPTSVQRAGGVRPPRPPCRLPTAAAGHPRHPPDAASPWS